MVTQIILALCEGPHDVAFICKILKSSGFVSNEDTKISDFKPPMGKLLSQEVIKTEVRELNLQQVRQNLLPLSTLQNDSTYVFLYSMGGDGKKNSRKHLLKSLRLSVPESGEITTDRLPKDTQLSLVYFFDADTKGVEARLNEVITEISTVITTIPDTAFPNNGSYCTCEGIKLGSYIFTGADNDKGKLEDILMPLMQSENDAIFNNASAYLNSHYVEERTLPLKLSMIDGDVVEDRSTRNGDKDYDFKKSIIGITGQLQRSGKPNTAYISDTDYLTLAKLKNNQKCQDIIVFFKKFINNI
jgi:hypothetical protein